MDFLGIKIRENKDAKGWSLFPDDLQAVKSERTSKSNVVTFAPFDFVIDGVTLNISDLTIEFYPIQIDQFVSTKEILISTKTKKPKILNLNAKTP